MKQTIPIKHNKHLSATRHFQLPPKAKDYQKMIRSRDYIDPWYQVCERCALDDCVRAEGSVIDNTIAEQRYNAAHGCTVSMARLRKKSAAYVLLHPGDFNLLTDEQIKERWG